MVWTCFFVAILGAAGEPSTTGNEDRAPMVQDMVVKNFDDAIDPAEDLLHSPDAALIFRADFEHDSDQNYDGWPDGWTRRTGLGYPPFAKVEIVKQAGAPSEKHVLQMSVDGGSILVNSIPIELHGQFSYAVEAALRTEGLKFNAARLKLKLTTADGKSCGELVSNWLRDCPNWTVIHLGPITPTRAGKLTGQLSLEVAPQTYPGDLAGKVWFDDIKITRLPRVTLTTNSEHAIYVTPERPRIVCQASGIQQARPRVEFVLLDALGNVLARETTDFVTSNKGTTGEEAPGFMGSVTWEPPVREVGYYRVQATMLGAESNWLTRESTFALVQPLVVADEGEFGWSLARGENPLPVGALSHVILQSGTHVIRFPVWFSPQDTATGDRLAWFAERLSMHNIELIGVLDQPPEELRTAFREKGELPAASIFSDPDLWRPAVDPVLTRLSLKVHRWQLGSDSDRSFVGYPDVVTQVESIRKNLNRFGQNLKLVVNWSWLNQVPQSEEGTSPWDALIFSANPALTAAELRSYLATTQPADETILAPQRCVQLQPLPASEYSLQSRVRDLVERMIAAKQCGADIIFASQPFDNENGLMRNDGTVGELFLPWRTVATQLSGCEYVGAFQLVGGSNNYVFARNGKAVMVLWNDVPMRETFTAEPGSRVIDVWGREQELIVNGDDTQLDVGPWPLFVVGMNEHLARWRIGTNFKSRQLESIFGREQVLKLKFKNPFPQSVAGEVTIHAPSTWEYPRHPLRFRVAEGEDFELPIPVLLSLDASGGAHSVKLDFDLTADERFKFSLFRTLYVGLEDINLDAQTRLLDDDSLQVVFNIQNQTSQPVSFNLIVFPPERRRETMQLLNLPPGRSSAKIILPNAQELLGERIYLRAEELGGQRVVNQSVLAER